MASRRNFLLGIGAALAAPAIVRAESLMKIAQLRRIYEPPLITSLDLASQDYLVMREITFRDGRLWMVGDRIVRMMIDDPRPFVFSTVPLERPDVQAS